MRLFLLCVVGVLAVGCTHDFTIFDPSDSAAPPVDAGGGDGGWAFQCGSGTVANCSQCNGMPQGCVYCQISNPSVYAGACTTMGTSCANTVPSGFARCACNTPTTCPDGDQVCRNGTCRTCSESQFNNGSACASGGTCNSFDGGCN